MSDVTRGREPMVEWLQAGPSDVPVAALEAAVAYARAHPHRFLTVRGLWRAAMTRLHLPEVKPHQSGGRISFALGPAVVGVVAVAALVGSGLWLGGGTGGPGGVVDPTGTPIAGSPPPTSPIPTARPTTAATPWVVPPGWARGTQECVTRTEGTSAIVDGVVESRGQVQDCTTTSSDPRLSGTAVITMNSDELEDGTWLGWGRHESTNADGSWRGTYAVTSTADAKTMSFDAVSLGSGAYDGLQVLLHVVIAYTGDITVDGIILPIETEVSGKETCRVAKTGHDLSLGDITATRGLVMDCTDTMTDERLSGQRRVTVSTDTRADESADVWGTSVVTNEGGTWEGFYFGTIDPGYSDHRVSSLMRGTGSYEGLFLRLEVAGTGNPGFDLRGEVIDAR